MQGKNRMPPKVFLRFFRWYCHPKLANHIEGDLIEVYNERVDVFGKRKADRKFILDVLFLFRPGIIRPMEGYRNQNTYGMYKSYVKVGWRNLLRHKGYSLINIGGLSLGLTVAMFIGLWIHDELSFNKYHQNYDDIAQVWSGDINPETSEIVGSAAIQYPVGSVLRNNYSQYFKHVLKASWIGDYTVASGEDKFSKKGLFIEPGVSEMLSLKMLKGSYKSLTNTSSLILSKSTADAIFGEADPINKTLTINSEMSAVVTGVYEDIPKNSTFSEVQFFAPWALWVSANQWLNERETDWDNRSFTAYVQLQPNVSMESVNAGIKDLYYKNVPADFFKTIEKYKPFIQLIPMNTWHLYSEFENGKPAGGRITFVWLFGAIGIFVLLLACINFVNLTTARSERRAREVGVRKAIGSVKHQLIMQFLSESLLVVTLAFILSVAQVALLKNLFNELADKDMALPFRDPLFWLLAIAFIVSIGFISGIYPAFYLSSFQPVKVLKGVFRAGRLAALPRKVLVVVQFTVSVVLIIGTLIVYKQIQFAQERPVGYDRSNLITVEMSDANYKGKHEVLKNELLGTGVVKETAMSSSPLTAIWNVTGGYTWSEKDPNVDVYFARCDVTLDFGRTVGWEFVAGRDFSDEVSSDSTDAVVINEAAARYMGLKNPVGLELTDVDEFGVPKWKKTIIGVVKDMVMESPYEPVRQTLYYYDEDAANMLHIKINPAVSAHVALPKIEAAINKVVPTALFDYKFVDEQYALKFRQEQRIGYLSTVFSILAIFISCLGLFGLASFVAEQRTKEIGIRKVVGASVFNLWKMLSKDFIVLVLIACVIATPVAYYFLTEWLQQFEYRTSVTWWIFVVTGGVALLITLMTVSYQALKAATMNPVKSLRSE